MIKLKIYIGLIVFVMLMTFSSIVSANNYEIDKSEISKGIINVKYSSDDDKIYKLKIMKGDEKVYYTLKKNISDAFSLTYGNGEYEIKILKNTTGSSYTTVYKTNITLNINNSSSIYLNSIQNIYWNKNMNSIIYSDKMVKETYESLLQKVKVYELIIFNYSYDYDKYSKVKSAYYLPVIDDTFNVKKGICYDFSSLLASMLRSQGVPTKLVKGYADFTDEYHAWNEVYINGKWYVIDTTYDAYYVKKGKVVTMLKPLTGYNKLYEY